MNDAQILWDLEATPPSSILVIIPRDFYKNIYFSMSNHFWLMCSFDNNSKSCSLFCMVKKINIGVLSLNHLKHNLRSLWENMFFVLSSPAAAPPPRGGSGVVAF